MSVQLLTHCCTLLVLQGPLPGVPETVALPGAQPLQGAFPGRKIVHLRIIKRC
jgi:hypothetical protein